MISQSIDRHQQKFASIIIQIFVFFCSVDIKKLNSVNSARKYLFELGVRISECWSSTNFLLLLINMNKINYVDTILSIQESELRANTKYLSAKKNTPGPVLRLTCIKSSKTSKSKQNL